MAAKVFGDAERSQTIALNALAYLAGDEDWLDHFLSATGMDLGDLKAGAGDIGFLAGLMDYFLQNEALLLAFAASEELAPETIVRARQYLPGALND
jgi:Protein of unknown function (DUF3572)